MEKEITMLVHSPRVRRAIDFAVNAHQGQRRKGKNVPYIVHPLTVAMILSRVGADEDLIIAGLLHDTVEDSKPPNAISQDTIRDVFGANVASHVDSVTEHDKLLSWDQRKTEALAKIESSTPDSLVLKSADVIANDQELIADWNLSGEVVFERFNADADHILGYKVRLIDRLLEVWPENPPEVWPENPLKEDLRAIRGELEQMRLSSAHSAGGR